MQKLFFDDYDYQQRSLLIQVSGEISRLQAYVYAISDQYPDMRQDLESIISELNKEPAVHSAYTDDGHIKVTLVCYVLYLERKNEVMHKLNRDIERRFRQAGIKFRDVPPYNK
jgi:hypothetical protein